MGASHDQKLSPRQAEFVKWFGPFLVWGSFLMLSNRFFEQFA